MKQVYLYPGQWAQSSEPAEIATILGSCVGIALYDYKLKTGALNHYLLPELPSGEAPSGRYGSVAIPAIVEAMRAQGSEHKSLQAKVFGGGSVLNGVTIGDGIGERNIAYALQRLEELRIPVAEKNVGGTRGRRISLNTETFAVKHVLQGGEKEPVDVTGLSALKPLKKVRVAIVDDSATVRSLFLKIFQKHGIEVVGTAANAYEARELIVRTKPDAITLDLEMPKMSGVVFLEKLMAHMPLPVVIVSSLGSQGEAAMRTLELGAIEFIHKPSQFDPTLLRQLGEMLVEKVKAAAACDISRKKITPAAPLAKNQSATRPKQAELKAIAVGGNAGSTDSLRLLLENLPADTPPVLIANGTIVSFLESYLSQLKRRVKVSLCVAQQGDSLKMGHVYFAPQDSHMRISNSGSSLTIGLSSEGPVCGQFPSSNVLFDSVAHSLGAGAAAILLGGFGSDGVDGLKKIRSQGGATFAENPAAAAFPYAPQQAIEIGVVDQVLDASEISEALTELRNQRVAA